MEGAKTSLGEAETAPAPWDVGLAVGSGDRAEALAGWAAHTRQKDVRPE